MEEKCAIFIVKETYEGKRLLSMLKEKLKNQYSVSDIRYAITRHRLRLNGRVERFESTKLKKNDHLEIILEKKPSFLFEKERVLFEDEYLCIYNKPAGIAVSEKEGLAALFSLFPVHRLDRDTTGALLFAKNASILQELIALFKKQEVEKSYLALVSPSPLENKGVIEKPLIKVGHKEGIVKWKEGRKGLFAKTLWTLEKRFDDKALLRCQPITGRTHQIRVHLSSMGSPLVGDVHYGSRHTKALRPLLHAERLSFVHPFTKKKIFVVCSMPQDFKEIIT